MALATRPLGTEVAAVQVGGAEVVVHVARTLLEVEDLPDLVVPVGGAGQLRFGVRSHLSTAAALSVQMSERPR